MYESDLTKHQHGIVNAIRDSYQTKNATVFQPSENQQAVLKAFRDTDYMISVCDACRIGGEYSTSEQNRQAEQGDRERILRLSRKVQRLVEQQMEE